MNKGLSNFQINKFFKDKENEEIKIYMGIYSMDSITRYINFYELIKRKNGKYPFAIFNTDEHDKPGRDWWSSNFLLQIMTTKLLTNYFMISKNVNLNQIKN